MYGIILYYMQNCVDAMLLFCVDAKLPFCVDAKLLFWLNANTQTCRIYKNSDKNNKETESFLAFYLHINK